VVPKNQLLSPWVMMVVQQQDENLSNMQTQLVMI